MKKLSLCEVEATKSIKHISKNIPKSSKIPDYTHQAYILDVSNAFRVEGICKRESKGKSFESSERSFNHPSLRKTYKPKEYQKKSEDQEFSNIAIIGYIR